MRTGSVTLAGGLDFNLFHVLCLPWDCYAPFSYLLYLLLTGLFDPQDYPVLIENLGQKRHWAQIELANECVVSPVKSALNKNALNFTLG